MEKAPNAFGLHDMHGNVWEWCEDVCDLGFHTKLEATGADPVCNSGSGDRVVRGGSWGFPAARSCSSTSRAGRRPAIRDDNIGFRAAFPLR
ncbi:MAG: SUMF1/EgtB/PvdO family nonheme iron enzyme [Planctomycetes bacterium]|nr:SUMF1/EgtB/PvdO family nonheme iron enzyme [Planctomycetota bacterium]